MSLFFRFGAHPSDTRTKVTALICLTSLPRRLRSFQSMYCFLALIKSCGLKQLVYFHDSNCDVGQSLNCQRADFERLFLRAGCIVRHLLIQLVTSKRDSQSHLKLDGSLSSQKWGGLPPLRSQQHSCATAAPATQNQQPSTDVITHDQLRTEPFLSRVRKQVSSFAFAIDFVHTQDLEFSSGVRLGSSPMT